ncbi:MAG: hypothetical protein ACOYNI_07415 [Acidimicrobiia bacterium]
MATNENPFRGRPWTSTIPADLLDAIGAETAEFPPPIDAKLPDHVAPRFSFRERYFRSQRSIDAELTEAREIEAMYRQQAKERGEPLPEGPRTFPVFQTNANLVRARMIIETHEREGKFAFERPVREKASLVSLYAAAEGEYGKLDSKGWLRLTDKLMGYNGQFLPKWQRALHIGAIAAIGLFPFGGPAFAMVLGTAYAAQYGRTVKAERNLMGYMEQARLAGQPAQAAMIAYGWFASTNGLTGSSNACAEIAGLAMPALAEMKERGGEVNVGRSFRRSADKVVQIFAENIANHKGIRRWFSPIKFNTLHAINGTRAAKRRAHEVQREAHQVRFPLMQQLAMEFEYFAIMRRGGQKRSGLNELGDARELGDKIFRLDNVVNLPRDPTPDREPTPDLNAPATTGRNGPATARLRQRVAARIAGERGI